jgi:hypothetical protein
VAAFVVPAVVVWIVWDYAGGPVEIDIFFHLAIARDYRTAPLEYSPRIAEGVLAEHPADREPLFHLALAGLLALGLPDLEAARLLCVVAGGTIGLVLFLHSGSFLAAACGVFGASTSFFRLLMCRPHLFAVAFVVAGVALIVRRRYRSAALVNLAYTLSYSVPVLLLAFVLLHSLQVRSLRGTIWMAASTAVGLVANPHFPANLVVLWYQGFWTMANSFAGNPSGIPVPGELGAWALEAFLVDAWLPSVLLLSAAVRRTTLWPVLAFQVLLLALALKSIRFIEYWVPVVALAAGPNLRYFLTPRSVVVRLGLTGLFLAAGPALAVRDAAITANRVAGERVSYEGAARFLANEAAGERVFNAEWEAYPELRYFGANFTILEGLDPIFIAAHDEARYREIAEARSGRLAVEDFLRIVRARWVVARRSAGILRYRDAGVLAVRYEDANVVVLEVFDGSGADRRAVAPRKGVPSPPGK